MQEKTITVRIEAEWKKRMDDLAKSRFEKRSDVIREAIIQYIKKHSELREIKKLAAKRFTEGKLSFDQLVELLGYEEAKKVAFFVEKAKKAFKGLK